MIMIMNLRDSKVKDICRKHKVQYVFHNDINKTEECFE